MSSIFIDFDAPRNDEVHIHNESTGNTTTDGSKFILDNNGHVEIINNEPGKSIEFRTTGTGETTPKTRMTIYDPNPNGNPNLVIGDFGTSIDDARIDFRTRNNNGFDIQNGIQSSDSPYSYDANIRLDHGPQTSYNVDTTPISFTLEQYALSGVMDLRVSDASAIYIDTTRKVGLGVTAPGHKLHVGGNVFVDNGHSVAFDNTNTKISNISGNLSLSANTSGKSVDLIAESVSRFSVNATSITPNLHIIPGTHNIHDLGTSSVFFRGIYGANAYFATDVKITNGKINFGGTNNKFIKQGANDPELFIHTVGQNSLIDLNCEHSSGKIKHRIQNTDCLTTHLSYIEPHVNIIPGLDPLNGTPVIDLGAPDKRFRALYLGGSSLWIGDQHKIAFHDNKMKFRRRKVDTVPAAVAAAGGTQAAALTHSGKSQLSDMNLEHWLAYMRTLSNQSTAEISDIFRDVDDDYLENTHASHWTVGAANKINTSDSVGIGVVNPSYPLHVVGDINYTGDLRKNGTIQNFSYFTETSNSGVNTLTYSKSGNDNANEAQITIQQTGSGKSKLILDAPDNDLLLIAWQQDAWVRNTGTGNFRFQAKNDTGYFTWATDANETERMRLTNDGKLGIGTVTPTQKLHVEGQIHATDEIVVTSDGDNTRAIRIYQSSQNIYTGMGVQSEGADGEVIFNWGVNHSVDGGTRRAGIDGAFLRIDTRTGEPYYDGFHFFWQNTSNNFLNTMSIKKDGNVGINDDTPSYKLEVNGTLHSTGTATSSDARIKDNITVEDTSVIYENFKNLVVKNYNYTETLCKATDKENKYVTGLIAQEVKEIFPEAVTVKPWSYFTGEYDEQNEQKTATIEDFHVIDTNRLLYKAIATIQELQKKVEALESA
tara:strand:- start:843 stop:3485 length:2643 start_codon:yes stop_codon:yes gene_type:complete